MSGRGGGVPQSFRQAVPITRHAMISIVIMGCIVIVVFVGCVIIVDTNNLLFWFNWICLWACERGDAPPPPPPPPPSPSPRACM